MNTPWLRPKEAAALAQVSMSTFYGAIARGEVRHSRIAGKRSIRISPEAVDEWLRTFERVPRNG
jgi:excisionase family DNA binding protein